MTDRSTLLELTKAQREAIVKIGDRKRPFGGMYRTGLDPDDELDLKRRGLVQWSIPPGCMGPICRLTPRGRRIFRALANQPEDQPNG